MFGLMKYREASLLPKYLYCGSCKSIGHIYSQKARLFLNYDVVFLNEILDMLDELPRNDQVAKQFESINCFNKISDTKVPDSFKFIAAANMILVRFKIQDNIIDNKFNLPWKFIKYLYSKEFELAQSYLNHFSVSEFFLDQWLTESVRRENDTYLKIDQYSDSQLLDYFSERVGVICGTIFSAGLKSINKAVLFDQMYELGYKFGQLVYLLDSLKDYHKDFKNRKFNWLIRTSNSKDKGVFIIENLSIELINCIRSLPLAEVQINYLVNSLLLNIESNLKNTEQESADNYFKDVFNKFQIILKYILSNPNPKYILNSLLIIPITPFESSHFSTGLTIGERVPCCCAPFVCCCGYCCSKNNG